MIGSRPRMGISPSDPPDREGNLGLPERPKNPSVEHPIRFEDVRSVLILTTLDIERHSNNLEHRRILHYTDTGCDVTVVYKTMNESSRLRDLVRNTVRLRIVERAAERPRIIAVDPFVNYFGGLRVTADAVHARGSEREPPIARLRRGLIRALAPLAMLRDLSSLLCLLAVTLRRVPHPTDVVLAFGPWAALIGLVLRRLRLARTIVYEDRDYEPGLYPDRLRRWYVGMLERFGIRRADVVISVSETLSDLRWSETGRRTHVIPSGVDHDRFAAASPPDPREARLIFVGNLLAWSGLEVAILAMRRILDTLPHSQLIVAGGAPAEYAEHLRRLADEHLPPRAVRLLGQRDPRELPQLLGAASIGLACFEPVPFRRYSTPLKVVEYMAAGLPIIATEGTEAARIVTQHDCGLVVRYESPDVADAVLRLLRDPELYARQSRNAVRHGVLYDWRALLGREFEIIADARGRPAARETGSAVKGRSETARRTKAGEEL